MARLPEVERAPERTFGSPAHDEPLRGRLVTFPMPRTTT